MAALDLTRDGAADPFQVELDRFQGPLDLLLHLIRNQDVNIFDIPIARITEQFLRVVEGIERTDLERAGEFLEMAATLVRIKAQMLFPRRSEEEEDDPRADLVRRLLEYEHFREAALRLERAQRERGRLWSKGYVEARPLPPLADAPLETTWDHVWGAARRLAERLEAPEEPVYRFASRPVRIEEKLELVMRTLERVRRVEFAVLVAPWGTRMHVVVSLLACLELAKRNAVVLRQRGPFSPLWLLRGEGSEA
jgi:segregation and condensation protein A